MAVALEVSRALLLAWTPTRHCVAAWLTTGRIQTEYAAALAAGVFCNSHCDYVLYREQGRPNFGAYGPTIRLYGALTQYDGYEGMRESVMGSCTIG